MNHQNKPAQTIGKLRSARNGMILLHGRGSTADEIISLHKLFNTRDTYFIAPQAANSQWYPKPFTQPLNDNQPFLDQSLTLINQLLDQINQYVAVQHTYILGFSQGACLTLEYIVRHPQKYGGAIALSGGLIGRGQELSGHEGDLKQTKVYLTCSQNDPYIPFQRVIETEQILNKLNANILTNFYPQPSHTITDTDINNLISFIN